jgi:EmrB/QacA subfamily drug resistance transporter
MTLKESNEMPEQMTQRTTTGGPTSGTTDANHARRWWIMAIIGIAQLMVVLDATVVNIAMPSAQEALGFSDGDRQWIITAYALSFGSLLLFGGRLSDLFGRKRTLVVGLIGFAVASAIGGAAQSFSVLVAARALQGAFGALLAPAALSLLSTTFTVPRERLRAFGIYGAIAGAGGAFGLLLGGVLTESLSWRWTMYVNLAFAVPAALGALALVKDNARAVGQRLDIPGTLTASAGLFALVYGFSQAESDGWGATSTLAFLAAGLVLLATFVAIQRRATHPLLPLRVVLERNRGGAFLAVGAVGAGIMGVFLFLTFYMQETLGYTPIESGLAFIPMAGGLVVSAAITTSRVLPRTGPRPLVAPGMLISAVGLILFTQLGTDASYVIDLLPGEIIAGAGLGLVLAPAMNIATLGVKAEDAGVASAMVNTMQQIGGSIGTALLSTLAASAASGYAVANQASTNALAEAAVHGYTTAFWWAAGIFAAGALISALLLRGPAPQLEQGAEPAVAHAGI